MKITSLSKKSNGFEMVAAAGCCCCLASCCCWTINIDVVAPIEQPQVVGKI